MDPDEQFGEPQPRLSYPDDHLGDLDGEENQRPRCGDPTGCGEDHQDNGQNKNEVGGPAVNVLEKVGIQAVAGSRLQRVGVVPGVWTGSGGENSEPHRHHNRDRGHHCDDSVPPRGNELRGAAAPVRPPDENRREDHKHH